MTKFLISLKEGISEVLGDNLIGVYIHGSLALGGFNCKTSDIDFVVLTKEILSSKDFELLKTFHKKLAEKYPKFGNRLEGSYITKFMLSENEPPDYPRPYLNGNQFIWAKYEYEWVLEKYVLRKHGITISGPLISELIPPIEVDELKTATVKLLCNTWKDLLNSDKIFRSEYQVFGVLTFCRMLYTLEIGEIVTKPQAVLWAKKKLEPSIEKLLDEALKWKPSEKFDHLEEIKKLFERIMKKYCN